MNPESDFEKIYEAVEDAAIGDYLILSNGYVYRKLTAMSGMWESIALGGPVGTKTAGTMTQLLCGAANIGITWSFS